MRALGWLGHRDVYGSLGVWVLCSGNHIGSFLWIYVNYGLFLSLFLFSIYLLSQVHPDP